METVPKSARIGCVLGLLGGVISIACMAIFFKAEESALADASVYMLTAVMFFALAGGFTKYGLWPWDILLLMTFLTIGVVGSSLILGAIGLYVGAMLVMIGILIIANLSMPSSKVWANRMRF